MSVPNAQLDFWLGQSALDVSLELSSKKAPNENEYGAVFTRQWVVELILELSGFTADLDLAEMMIIEPACGNGAFLGPIVERLVLSCEKRQRPLLDAKGALYACDLQPESVFASQNLVEAKLIKLGCEEKQARELANAWVHHDDFLLSRHSFRRADFVLGNPPYIRLEAVETERLAAYRQACEAMRGRSDVYVGFFEAGLKLLKEGGVLGFICADRWMRNQYGQKLRKLISDQYDVRATIEMHNVNAFETEVSTYPSITILRRGAQKQALLATAKASFDQRAAKRVHTRFVRQTNFLKDADLEGAWLPGWFSGDSSWPSGSPEQLAVVKNLEHRFPLLENPETGTRVGIGVATGADQIFITQDREVAEGDRLLPLAMTRDTISGAVKWSGNYLVDPWNRDTGKLVELDEYPLLTKYLETHGEVLKKRHVASRQPQQWYRTIDRVDHTLIDRPKLLLPDIKSEIHPVLDEGNLYPHHNLYFITSNGWNMEVLGGLLLSKIAQLFVKSYAVKMRGGYLRFQAQYLRRIRVPTLNAITNNEAKELRAAFMTRDTERATRTAMKVYGIDELPL